MGFRDIEERLRILESKLSRLFGRPTEMSWGDVSDKPPTFPPSDHTHTAADIDSGTLSTSRLPTIPVSKGGTGASTKAAAQAALGIPFAQAAGVIAAASVGSGATRNVTVTFPVGRFTQPPVVTPGPTAPGAIDRWTSLLEVTKDSCAIAIGNSWSAAIDIGAHWHAVQMTSGSGSG